MEQTDISKPPEEENPKSTIFASKRENPEPPVISKPSKHGKSEPIISKPSKEENPSSIVSVHSQEENPEPVIAEHSQEENPEPVIAEHSHSHSQEENPEPVNSEHSQGEKPSSPIRFCPPMNILEFKIKAETLKKAIAPLVDREFNPEGLGRIEMSVNGFNIMVCNPKSYVMCRLFLDPKSLTGYVYYCLTLQDLTIKKTAKVERILGQLTEASDDDIVTVYYPHKSTRLFFQYGNDHADRFSVTLSEPDDEVEMFPNYWTASSSVGWVPNKGLKRMIKQLHSQLEKKERPIVSASVSTFKNAGSLAVGEKNIKKQQELQAKAWSKPNTARFYWKYAQSLEKASKLKGRFDVHLYGEPMYCIMLRFEYEGVGTLFFLTNAESTHFV